MDGRDLSGMCECLRQFLEQQASELSSMFQSLNSHDVLTANRGYSQGSSPFGDSSLRSSNGVSSPFLLMMLFLALFMITMMLSGPRSRSTDDSNLGKPSRDSNNDNSSNNNNSNGGGGDLAF